jgi:arginine/lysine/ornithine decarboxylase
VIESVHKTLPALTQTALLHLCGKRVNAEKVEECLGMYQSSSPSYVLMSSIDKCIRQLQTNGTEMMEKLLITLEKFRKDVNCLNYIKIPEKELKGRAGVYDVDLTKLVIYVNPAVCDGKNLATILREKYHFEMEMESAEYVLGITTICDDEDEIIRLGKALKEIDEGFSRENNGKNFQAEKKINYRLLENEIKCSLYQAEKSESEPVPLENSIGRISGEFLYLYPPGIPLLVPGEVISKELLEQIEVLKRQRLNLNGLKDKKNRKIQVLK